MTNKEIEDIRNILIIEGHEHSSKYNFKVGEIIKFTPTQVEDILKNHFSDSISRREVLEAVEEENRSGAHSCFASWMDAERFKAIVDNIPSNNN